ncbi:MAG: lipid A biosynthesis acyltransferase [Pseudomonadota bacterium]
MLKTIRYLLEALLVYLLFGIFKLMPAAWASNIGGFLGKLIGPKLAASRKALRNIENALPKADHQKILIGMWDNLGRTFAEYPHLKTIAQKKTVLHGANHLEANKDKTAIIFAAHLANWEITPITAAVQRNFVAHSIYRAPNNHFVGDLLMRCRNLNGLLKPIPKSKSGTRDMLKRLQSNQAIGFLIDQKYNEGTAVNFFHAPAMVSPAYIQLTQKFNCALIPARVKRLKGCSFEMEVFEPIETNKSEAELLSETHLMLENWIKEAPEQWLWLHRRWNSAKLKEEK